MALSSQPPTIPSLASFRLPSFDASFPPPIRRRYSVDMTAVAVDSPSSERAAYLHQHQQPPRTPVFVAPLTPSRPPPPGTPTSQILDGRSLPLTSPSRKRPSHVAFDPSPAHYNQPYPAQTEAEEVRRSANDRDEALLQAKLEPEASPEPQTMAADVSAVGSNNDGADAPTEGGTGPASKRRRVTLVFGDKDTRQPVKDTSKPGNATAKAKPAPRVAPLKLGGKKDGQPGVQTGASSSGSSNGQLAVVPPSISQTQLLSPASPIVMGFDAASAMQDPSRAPTIRKTMSLKEQQMALIESRRHGNGRMIPPPPNPNADRQSDNDADADMEDVHEGSIADRRGEKGRNLTIQTATTSNGPSIQKQHALQHRLPLTSIKSAPIRPEGYQAAVQTQASMQRPPNTSYPQHAGSHSNKPPLDAHRSGNYGSEYLGQPHPNPHHQHVSFTPHSAARLNEPYPPPPPPATHAGGAPGRSHHYANVRSPPPNTYPGPLPPPPHQPPPLTGVRLPAPSHHYHGMPPAKAAFLSLFDTFYDSLGDSRVLSMNLDDQIRRSSALLSTLQQSSGVFENMLDRRIGDLTKSLTADLQVLEGRIERLEQVHESQGGNLPPLTPSLVNLQKRSFRHLQQSQHGLPIQGPNGILIDRRHSMDSSYGVAEASASIARRLDRLEHDVPRPGGQAHGSLSHHAASNLHSLVAAAEASNQVPSSSSS